MKKTIFTGAGVAIITPMNSDLSINYKKLSELLDYQITHGSDAVIIAGTTGEASTLTGQEHEELIRYTVEYVNHRVPVIAGVGSNNTAQAVERSKMGQRVGADALLHVTPYYNKTSQNGLIKHFSACAQASNLPVVLYNIPSRTGVNIQPETYLKLLDFNETIVAVKEASGNFSQIAKIASLCQDRLDIYSGNDDQITSALALGSKGVISVLSNILPQTVHDICTNFFENRPQDSDSLQLQYLELIESLFYDVNPIPIKTAMNLMGMEVGQCRLPLCEMDDILAEKLLKVLKKYGLYHKEDTAGEIKTASILHENNNFGQQLQM